MNLPKIVSRDEWLAVRKEFLREGGSVACRGQRPWKSKSSKERLR
jgi:hypothetical protein